MNPLNLGNTIDDEELMNFFNEEKYEAWKQKKYPMKKSVAENFERLTDKPNIVIIGDYDVDGVTGTYLAIRLMQYLHPEAEINFIAPRRFSDGYGISNDILNTVLTSYDPKDTCIITVDNGISQFKPLNTLFEAGFTICLTDHHLPQVNADGTYKLPYADIIINPHVLDEKHKDDFQFEDYCGAAVIYKIAQQLLPADVLEKEFLPYASIATHGDVVPLVEDNWVMTHHFLENIGRLLPPELNFTKKPAEYVDEEDIGFYICPTLNAPGRLLDAGATKAIEYLLHPTEPGKTEMKSLNEERKKFKAEQTEMAIRYIEENNLADVEPICVNIPGLHHGIVGIVAGKVTETYKKACMICSDGRGSGRAPIGFDIYQFCKDHETLFKQRLNEDGTVAYNEDGTPSYIFGGHPGACGFSITDENFEVLASFAKPKTVEKKKEYDLLIKKDQISEIYQKTKKFRPFGEANPSPKYMVQVRPGDNLKWMGKEAIHLSVLNKDGSKVVHFYHKDPETKDSGLAEDTTFDGTGKINLNYFPPLKPGGRPSINAQLTIEEVFDPEENPIDFRRF